MNLDNLANNLRILRLKENISGKDLAYALNLTSDRRIYDIESKKNIAITDEEIDKIATYFKRTREELLNKTATIIFT